MANNDNIKWMYDQLTSRGANLGSIDDFSHAMADSANRKWAYDYGRNAGLNLGSEDDFAKAMGVTTAAVDAPEAVVPGNSASPAPNNSEAPLQQMEQPVENAPTFEVAGNGYTFTEDELQKMEEGQRPVLAPAYGSAEYASQKIEGDASNPYAGMTRQQAINAVGSKFFNEWYGKGYTPETTKEVDGEQVKYGGLGAYDQIRAELAANNIVAPEHYANVTKDIRRAYIQPVARRRVEQLMSGIDTATHWNLDEILSRFDSREAQQAINQDLERLGFAPTPEAYDGDEAAMQRDAQRYEQAKQYYYQQLQNELQNVLVDKYGWLPSSDARSHVGSFKNEIMAGTGAEHEERIRDREALNMVTKYATPQVQKYFNEAEEKGREAYRQALNSVPSVSQASAGTYQNNMGNALGAALYAGHAESKETDPGKIWAAMEPNLKQMGVAIVSDPGFISQAEARAAEEGVELTDYMQRRVLPVLESIYQKEFERIAVENEMPKNFVQYALGKMRESLPGMLINAVFTSQARRRAQQRAMQLTEVGQGKWTPNSYGRIGGGFLGMVPELALYGAAGKLASPVGGAVAQELSGAGFRPLVSRLAGASITGAGTMGGAETVKGFTEGLLNDNDYEHMTDEDDRSFLDVLGGAVKNAVERGVPSTVSGLTMVGSPLGQKISNGRGIIGNILGWGTQVGVDAAGATAVSVIRGDVKPEDAGRDFLESVGTFAALGLQHKAKEFKALANGGRSWNGVEFTKDDIQTLEDFGLDKFRNQMKDIERARNRKGLIGKSLGLEATKEQVEAAKSEGARLYNDMMHSYAIPYELKVKVAQAMSAPIPDYAVKPEVLELSARVPAESVDLGLIDMLEYEYNREGGVADKTRQGQELDSNELNLRLLFQENKAFNEAVEKLQRGEELTDEEQSLIVRNQRRLKDAQNQYFRLEHERINREFEAEHGLDPGTMNRLLRDVAEGKAIGEANIMKEYEEYLRSVDQRLGDARAEIEARKAAEAEAMAEAEKQAVENTESQEGGVPQNNSINPAEDSFENAGTPPPSEKRNFELNDEISFVDDNGVTRNGDIVSVPSTSDGTFAIQTEEGRVFYRDMEFLQDHVTKHNGETIEKNVSSPVVSEPTASAEGKSPADSGESTTPSALSRIPVNEKGEPDYERAKADDSYDALVEELGEEDAATIAHSEVDDATKRLQRLQKQGVKGATIEEKKRSLAERALAIKEQQAKIDYWNSVLEVPKARKAEEERVRAEEERKAKMQTPEGRAELISSGKDTQERIAIAKEIYGDYFNENTGEPDTVEELVSLLLPYGKLNWEGYQRGITHVRGLQEELGSQHTRGLSKDRGTSGFNSYLAKKGEGESLDSIVHSMYEDDANLAGDEHRFTTEEIKNAVLDMLLSAEKPTDIKNYTLNSRIENAERIMRAELEREANFAEEAKQAETVVEEPNQNVDTNEMVQTESEMPFEAPTDEDAPFQKVSAEDKGIVEQSVESEAVEKAEKEAVTKAEIDKAFVKELDNEMKNAGVKVADTMEEVAEGQAVLDAFNGEAKMMGTTTRNRQNNIASELKDKELSAEQQTVVDVFTGKDNQALLKIEDVKGKERSILFTQGNDKKAGAKHSIFRHNGTNKNWYTAEEVTLIPDVIHQGKRTQEGNRVSYTLDKDGVKFTVTTLITGKKEKFTNFLTNRKPNAAEQGTQNTANQRVQPQQTASEKTGADGEVSTHSDATQANPTFSREDLGAVLSDAKLRKENETSKNFEEKIRQQKAEAPIFVSNAMKAVEVIRQEKATPEQWLKMIEKNGGLKAGEDKWMGLSDWLKEQKGSITKQEVLDFIRKNQIEIEETNYSANVDLDNNPQMQKYRKEFDDLVSKYESEKAAVEEEANAFNDEMFEKYGEGWANDPDRLSEKDQQRNDDMIERWDRLNDANPRELAFQDMVDNHGDDFEMAFEVNYGNGQLDPSTDFYGDNISEQARYFLGLDEQPINSTRLDYTTNGLQNKREIALTVPTVEPWNESDEVHFGDAGEGRAVAWVRFGDAYVPNMGGDPNDLASGVSKVLVIDEIQSKRHQEGRENGYRSEDFNRIDRRIKELEQKKNRSAEEDVEYKELMSVLGDMLRENPHPVPDAPFEKNWHELAMKRMLRYAAENGYDKVAWTKGEQQAERYSLSKAFDSVEREDNPSVKGRRFVFSGRNVENFVVDDEGKVIDSTINDSKGKNLSELVGKDMAVKLMALENGDIIEDGLSIGGEGMKGFYDQMLPRFMDKYGKKWGVKTGEIELPDVEPSARKMWSVDVTPEMKESMMQGQPMFFKTPGGHAYGFTYKGKIYVDPRIATAETPIHEYGHLWAEMKRQTSPKEWQAIKEALLNDKVVDPFIDKVKREYPELLDEGREDDFIEEVLTQFSGKHGAERLRRMAEEIKAELGGDATAETIAQAAIRRVKSVLNDFWKSVCNMMGWKYTNAEDVADTILRDMLNGVNPNDVIAKAREGSKWKDSEEVIAELSEPAQSDAAGRMQDEVERRNSLPKFQKAEADGYRRWKSEDEMKQRAEELSTAIKALGYYGDIRKSKNSVGTSYYVIVSDKNFYPVAKLRISDHSVTNTSRVLNEYHVYPDKTTEEVIIDLFGEGVKYQRVEGSPEPELTPEERQTPNENGGELINAEAQVSPSAGKGKKNIDTLQINSEENAEKNGKDAVDLMLDEVERRKGLPKFQRVGSNDKIRYVDQMKAEEKDDVRKRLEDKEAIPAAENAITKREGMSARNVAMEWADKNIPNPKTVGTEIGDLVINKKSISDSLAHGFSQAKLDAIPTLLPVFEEGRAVYIGSGEDNNGDPITDHYFAYPINYKGNREFVFCRTREDQNTHRLYIHEVITGEDIEKGQTLQSTAPEKPRTGLPLYRNIMSDVFGSKGKKNNDTLQINGEENAGKNNGKDAVDRMLDEVDERRERVRLQKADLAEEEDIARQVYEDAVAKESLKWQEAWQDSMVSLKKLQDAIEAETGNKAKGAEDAYAFENRMHGKAKNQSERFEWNYYQPMLKAFDELTRERDWSNGQAMDYLISKHGLERNGYYAFRDALKEKVADEVRAERENLDKQYGKKKISEEVYKQKLAELQERERTGVEDAMADFRSTLAYKRAKEDYREGNIDYSEYLRRVESLMRGFAKRKNPKRDREGNIVSENYYDDHVKDYSGLTETLAKDMYDEAQKVKRRAQRTIDPDKKKDLWSEYEKMMREAYITARQVAEDAVFAGERQESGTPIPMKDTAAGKLWEKINDATKETLRISYESGMMDRNTYHKVRDMFDYYVPLRGWEENKASDVYSYIGKENVFSPAVKKTWGRTSKAENPLAYIGNIATSTILSGNRNLMKQHFLNYVMNNPTSLTSISESWYENVGSKENPVWVLRSADTAGKSADEISEIVNDFNEEMLQKQKEGMAIPVRGRLRLDVNATKGEKSEHVVEVQRNGHTYQIYVNGDPKAAQALNGTTARAVSRISDTFLGNKLGNLNRSMAAFFTSKNPAFVLSNLSRDLNMAGASVAVNEGAAYNARFVKNVGRVLTPRMGESSQWMPASKQPTGMMPDLMRKYKNGTLDMDNDTERYFSEFMSEGGETGFVNMLSVDSFKKKMQEEIGQMHGSDLFARGGKECSIKKGLRVMGDVFEFYNRCAEDATRFIVYMTSREMGKTMEESIADAKNVTLNFNRKGTGAKGNAEIRDLFIFVNPAIQALANMYSMGKRHPLKLGATAMAFMAGGAMMPVLNQWLLNMFGDNDDKQAYWNLPPWVRKNNLICWIPGTKNFLTIPLAQEFRVFYGVGEMISSAVMDHPTDKMGLEIASSVADLVPINPTGNGGNLMIDFMPTGSQPLMQLAFNTDFTGKPIWRENQGNKYDPAFSKAYVSTPKWMVKMSEAINSATGGDEDSRGWLEKTSAGAYLNNPAVWNHLLQGYLGGMYNTISKAFDTAASGAGYLFGDGDAPKVYQVPVLNRFLNRPVERENAGALGEDYWQLVNDNEEFLHNLRAKKKKADAGDEKAREKLDNLLESEDYRRSMVINQFKGIIDGLRKEEKATTDQKMLEAIRQSIGEYKAELMEEIEAVDGGQDPQELVMKKFDDSMDMKRRKSIGTRIAKAAGASEDSYGEKPQTDYAYQYQVHRTAQDVYEDATLLAYQEKLRDSGDEEGKNILSKERAKVREKARTLNGTQNDEAVMEQIRSARRKLLDKYGLLPEEDGEEQKKDRKSFLDVSFGEQQQE